MNQDSTNAGKKPMMLSLLELSRRSSVEFYDPNNTMKGCKDDSTRSTRKDPGARMSISNFFRGCIPKTEPSSNLIPPEDEPLVPPDEEAESESESSAKEQSDDEITILTPVKPQVDNITPVEVIDYIEIFEEDDLDDNYKHIRVSEMICEVCERQFKHRNQFCLHHRRHIAQEMFQCPTCLKGFVSLRLCTNHEIRVHKKIILRRPAQSGQNNCRVSERESSPSSMRSSSDVSSSTNEEEDDVDPNFCAEDGWKRILPSNALIPYRGPPLEHISQCFAVELKYQPKNRAGSNSISNQIQALWEHHLIIGDYS
ncbi:unnamed protein product [Allacma fusca]|uniref:C2H2-type domain-containing protein n=1 Tax=Allacma fusca TaxID=39272 RepID=A0A8J2KFG9_9HEXA|nr:unnamed protein product [Allacma fusca]